ncbi:MAG: hypothetical protein AB1657_01295 [Candidatus Micrarchaeota archaeon]
MAGGLLNAARDAGKDMLQEFYSAVLGSFKVAAGIALAAIALGLLLLTLYLLTKKKE